MSEDLRELIDPISAVLRARPRWRQVPEQVVEQPPDSDGNPRPPVTYPARTEIYVDPAELPEEIAAGEGVNLGAQVAMVQSMLAWIWDEMQFRSVTAQGMLRGTYLAGQEVEIPVTWYETPEKTPTSAAVTINAPITWLGRTSARINQDSVTATGATVIVSVLNAITPGETNPIAYDVTGTYFWVPPYQPGETST